MKTPYQMVKEFHEVFGHPVGNKPGFVDEQRAELRVRLIREELDEVLEAAEGGTLEEFAKELADLTYVVYGFAIEAGIDLDRVTTAVHQSNMSKLGPDGKAIFRDDGKILKGPDYFEPDIESVLY